MTEWADLPSAIHTLAADHVGTIDEVEAVNEATVRDLSVVLRIPSGRVFCKGIRCDAPLAWTLRNEARINPWLPRTMVPALRFTIEAEGWLLAGFDHVAGRYPDLSPGSSDLDRMATTMSDLAVALTPCPTTVRSYVERWADLIPAEYVEGDTLLHTDVTPKNFILTDDTVWLVDWAAPARGAAWTDAARMVVRLIIAGHDPGDAESWAEGVGCWADAPVSAVTAFAKAYAALTAQRHAESPAPYKGELADAAAFWANRRQKRPRGLVGKRPRTLMID